MNYHRSKELCDSVLDTVWALVMIAVLAFLGLVVTTALIPESLIEVLRNL